MICAGLGILALWLMPTPAAHRLQAAVRDTFTPFTALNRLHQRFAQRPKESEIIQLHEQIAQLTLENRGLQALERENRELRRLLNLSRRMPYRIKAARIAMRDLTTWWQTARLDRGARDGITPGMPALAAEGLVGQVLEVSKRTADVTFLINPACRVAGMIPRVDAFGIVRGEGMSLRGPPLCRMDFIARDMDIRPGDEVVTSGLGGIFPPGLLIGYVRQTRQDPTGLYQSAEILPAADFRNLQMVFLVSDTGADADTSVEGGP